MNCCWWCSWCRVSRIGKDTWSFVGLGVGGCHQPFWGDVEVEIHPREVRICRWCVGVVCFLAWFLIQVFRCGKGWIRLVAADLDHLRVAFPDRAAFSACSHLMKLYKNSRTPLQQRGVVNVNLIETWNLFFLSILGVFHRISSLHPLLSRNFGTLQSSSDP